jgi:hypothetical protein
MTDINSQPIPPVEKRKPGRPRKFAPWFAAVAKRMADGTTLRHALMWEGLHFTNAEIHALYKNLEFRRMYRLERHLYMLNEYGKRPQTEIDRLRKALERRIA